MLAMIAANHKKHQKGFTFLEVIVAVFVIALVVVGVFSAIQKTTTARFFAFSQLQAVYLAQEGIELVRNQRDHNWLENVGWDDNKNNLIADFDGGTEDLGRFERSTTINNQGDKIVVSVTVSWPEKGGGEIEVITELHNWYR